MAENGNGHAHSNGNGSMEKGTLGVKVSEHTEPNLAPTAPLDE